MRTEDALVSIAQVLYRFRGGRTAEDILDAVQDARGLLSGVYSDMVDRAVAALTLLKAVYEDIRSTT